MIPSLAHPCLGLGLVTGTADVATIGRAFSRRCVLESQHHQTGTRLESASLPRHGGPRPDCWSGLGAYVITVSRFLAFANGLGRWNLPIM